MPSSLKCLTKLPGYGFWMTMVSAVTLGSVEFLDIVGGDLEAPPDEYFEVEIMASRIDDESGERSTN